MCRVSALVLFSSIATVLVADGSAALQSITSAEIQAHVDILAGQEMQGRGAGTEGGKLAGEYIAARLAEIGLRPGGAGGSWFQPFGNGMRNVVGLLPGRDPAVAGEYVLIGGHYDHLGSGEHGGSLDLFGRGGVHWGADDNASGTAGVIEIAEALALDPPRRSVIFILFDGEEMGLLGSRHYTKEPLYPLAKTIATCNLDMIGRLEGRAVVVYGAGTGSGFRAILDQAGPEIGVELEYAKEMTPNSDHYSFVQKEIPSVHLFSGLHKDYHRPGDTADKLDEQGAEEIARLAYRFVDAVADDTNVPVYADVPLGGPDFGEMLEMLGLDLGDLGDLRGLFGRGQGQKPKLGVTLEDGLTVASIVDDTPAARSSLSVGDEILGLDGEKVRDLAELRSRLNSLEGIHRFVVARDGNEIEVEVDFGGGDKPKTRWF